MVVVNRFTLGQETVNALCEASSHFEGSFAEVAQGVSVQFRRRDGEWFQMFVHERYLPKDPLLRDLYIAHRIRKFAKQLNEGERQCLG